ncbi:MAG: ribonuclease P protein component [Acidimicrobiia bacterium]
MTRPVRDRATFEVLARARRLRSGPIWLRCAPSSDADVSGARAPGPRVAYTITKAAGNAVDRNRIRRRLRAAVAAREPQLDPERVYLFGADRRVLHAPFAAIDNALGELLRAASELER